MPRCRAVHLIGIDMVGKPVRRPLLRQAQDEGEFDASVSIEILTLSLSKGEAQRSA